MSDWKVMDKVGRAVPGDREALLEAGIILLAVGLVAGAGFLLLSNAAGNAANGRRQAQGAPAAGSVAPSRHAHVSTAAAR